MRLIREGRHAKKIKIFVDKVRLRRIKLGIEPHTHRPAEIEWTPDLLCMLGEVADLALAKEWGISCSSISVKRRCLGIPSFVTRKQEFVWRDEYDDLLRRMSNRAVAKKLKISSTRVKVERSRRNIAKPSGKDFRRIRWSEHILNLLRKVPLSQITLRFGISYPALRAKCEELGIRRKPFYVKWPSEALTALGTMSDYELGKRFGIHHRTVAGKRISLNIQSFHTHSPAFVWTPKAESLIGTASDAHVAKLLGTTRRVVTYRKQQLKIGPFQRQDKRGLVRFRR